MTYEEVRMQLAGVTYEDSIKYYVAQKRRFIKSYSSAVRKAGITNAKNYIKDFVNYVNNSEFQQKSFQLTSSILNSLDSALETAIEGNSALLKQITIDSSKKYSELTQKGKQELQNALAEIFDLDIINQQLTKALLDMQITGGVTLDDLHFQIQGYLNAKLFNILKGNPKYYGNRSVIAGFFEEALVHNATALLTQHLSNNFEGSFQASSKKISINSNGRSGKIDSIFDEYFNFFSKDLNMSFSSSINIDDNSLTQGYGAQIKLWNPPWRIKHPRKIYPIASNVNLFQQWDDKRGWIQGVLFLEHKVQNALGDNVMYILGNQFLWTHELIQNFRDREYYLAFNHNGEKFTQKIAWEMIDMSKPNKN